MIENKVEMNRQSFMEIKKNNISQAETQGSKSSQVEFDKIPFDELSPGKFKCQLCSKVVHNILVKAHAYSHASLNANHPLQTQEKAKPLKESHMEQLPVKEKIRNFKNSYVAELPLKEKIIKIGTETEKKSKELSYVMENENEKKFIKTGTEKKPNPIETPIQNAQKNIKADAEKKPIETSSQNAQKIIKADAEKNSNPLEASIKNAQKIIKGDAEKPNLIEAPIQNAQQIINTDAEKNPNHIESSAQSAPAQITNENTSKSQNFAIFDPYLKSSKPPKTSANLQDSEALTLLEKARSRKAEWNNNILSQVVSQALNLQNSPQLEIPMKRQRSFCSVPELLKKAKICGIIINRLNKISGRVIYIRELHSFRIWKRLNNKFY